MGTKTLQSNSPINFNNQSFLERTSSNSLQPVKIVERQTDMQKDLGLLLVV